MSINSIIKNIEERSITDNDIADILQDPRIKVINYDIFDSINDLDEVLDDRLDAVIFLMRGSDVIGHWVTLIGNRDTMLLEFFDPYGLGLNGNLRIATSNSNVLPQLFQKNLLKGMITVKIILHYRG